MLFQSEHQLDSALDLMRRLPPQQIEKNLADLIDLVSDYDVHCALNSGSHLLRQVLVDLADPIHLVKEN